MCNVCDGVGYVLGLVCGWFEDVLGVLLECVVLVMMLWRFEDVFGMVLRCLRNVLGMLVGAVVFWGGLGMLLGCVGDGLDMV